MLNPGIFPGPYTHSGTSVGGAMALVTLALVPATLFGLCLLYTSHRG